MEKFLEYLYEAEKIIKTSDHLMYITYPIVNDKRLLLKITLELKNAVKNILNSILQFEYLFKRITLYSKNPKANFKTFEKKCAPRYNINSYEIKLINELFEIAEKSRLSSMEFVKDKKIVILSENMEKKILTVEKTKQFLQLCKNIHQKAKNKFLDKI